MHWTRLAIEIGVSYFHLPQDELSTTDSLVAQFRYQNRDLLVSVRLLLWNEDSSVVQTFVSK